MIYKTKVFAALTKKDKISDEALITACKEMLQGLLDADLGGNLYKKRIAIGNRGKSGGLRTIIGAVIGNKYFFLYAFAKSDKTNINTKEQLALRELAKEFLKFDDDKLQHLVDEGELIKVGHYE